MCASRWVAWGLRFFLCSDGLRELFGMFDVVLVALWCYTAPSTLRAAVVLLNICRRYYVSFAAAAGGDAGAALGIVI